MGEVIQLFRDEAPPEDFVFEDHVSEEAMDVIAGLSYSLAHIEQVTSAAEFVSAMASIKGLAAALPDT